VQRCNEESPLAPAPKVPAVQTAGICRVPMPRLLVGLAATVPPVFYHQKPIRRQRRQPLVLTCAVPAVQTAGICRVPAPRCLRGMGVVYPRQPCPVPGAIAPGPVAANTTRAVRRSTVARRSRVLPYPLAPNPWPPYYIMHCSRAQEVPVRILVPIPKREAARGAVTSCQKSLLPIRPIL
jgi:hypothetical protein